MLFRGGDGQRALAAAASLRSLSRGNDPDPEALAAEPGRVDVDEARARFERDTGSPPERWLDAWHAERLVRNAENYARAVWADLLVQP